MIWWSTWTCAWTFWIHTFSRARATIGWDRGSDYRRAGWRRTDEFCTFWLNLSGRRASYLAWDYRRDDDGQTISVLFDWICLSGSIWLLPVSTIIARESGRCKYHTAYLFYVLSSKQKPIAILYILILLIDWIDSSLSWPNLHHHHHHQRRHRHRRPPREERLPPLPAAAVALLLLLLTTAAKPKSSPASRSRALRLLRLAMFMSRRQLLLLILRILPPRCKSSHSPIESERYKIG